METEVLEQEALEIPPVVADVEVTPSTGMEPEPIKVLAKQVTKQHITFTVAPGLLTPNRGNVRYRQPSEARLRRLAESMATHQIEPIGVEKLPGSALGIVHGTNRYLAALYGIEHEILPADWEIRYELVDVADEAAKRLLNITENVERENLSPIDMAVAFNELVTKDGYTQRDAAAVLGKKAAWGNAAMMLLQLPEKYKQMVHEGAMSAELGFELVTAETDKAKAVLKALKTKELPLTRTNFRAELREISDAELPDTGESAEALTGENPVQEDPEAKLAPAKKKGSGRKKLGNKATKRSVSDMTKFWGPYAEGGDGISVHAQALGKIMMEFALGKCSNKRMDAFVATVRISKPKAD